MYKNELKAKMKNRPVFGMTIYSGAPQIIEAVGIYGLDFVFIDAEHSSFDVCDLRECVLAARMVGTSPLVRVTGPNEIEIRKAFEMGAEGVIIPHVKTKDDMELCVRAGKFPPQGRRGYDATVRSASYGGFGYNASEYIEYSNETELIIPMAEDYEFIDNLEDIMSVEGYDAINFGPADFALSKNIRVFYDINQPEVQSALSQIEHYTTAKKLGLMAPAIPPTKESVNALIEKGVNMIILGSDMFNFQNKLNELKNGILDQFISD